MRLEVSVPTSMSAWPAVAAELGDLAEIIPLSSTSQEMASLEKVVKREMRFSRLSRELAALCHRLQCITVKLSVWDGLILVGAAVNSRRSFDRVTARLW